MREGNDRLGFVGGAVGAHRKPSGRAIRPRCAAVPALSDFVEQTLMKKFETRDIERVLQSWYSARDGKVLEQRTDDGYVLQRAESWVKGLTAKPWHETEEYEWAQKLEEDYEEIVDEFDKCMRLPSLEKRGNNVWASAVKEEAMAYGPDWRTLVLQDRGIWEPKNAKIFRDAVRILRKDGVPSSEVFFARQAPKTGIKPHTDNTNFTLTAHLALHAPKDKSWISVGNEKRFWEDGKMLTFDTSYMHETWNDGDTDRDVLLIRFWHPELTRKEIKALELVFRSIEEYEVRFAR